MTREKCRQMLNVRVAKCPSLSVSTVCRGPSSVGPSAVCCPPESRSWPGWPAGRRRGCRRRQNLHKRHTSKDIWHSEDKTPKWFKRVREFVLFQMPRGYGKENLILKEKSLQFFKISQIDSKSHPRKLTFQTRITNLFLEERGGGKQKGPTHMCFFCCPRAIQRREAWPPCPYPAGIGPVPK